MRQPHSARRRTRSDRLICEMLDCNILVRWFLDMKLEERALDQSKSSRLRERPADTDLACRFFDAMAGEPRKLNLPSDEHFTFDGTLIEARAPTGSGLRRQGGPPDAGGADDQGMVDLDGERRSIAIYVPVSDGEGSTAFSDREDCRRIAARKRRLRSRGPLTEIQTIDRCIPEDVVDGRVVGATIGHV